MKVLHNIGLALILLISTPFFAQESNVFLDRAYWKSNPTIADIDKKIKEGNDIAQLNKAAFDAVSWALIEKVDNETIKYLLSKDGNGVNKLTHDGRTYIFWAAYRDNLEIMKYLVDKGAKTDIIDSHGYSVLNFAAVTGQTNTKLYDFLIRLGANPVTDKNHNGANALLLVSPFLKDDELVNFLMSHKVNLKSTDSNGDGIFAYAAKGGNVDFMEWLIKKGIAKDKNAMIMASQGTRGKKNTLDFYKFLEEKGLESNVTNKKGRNPLHAIAYEGEDLETYTYFIDKGVDVNQQDEDGKSPFINASGYNNLEVVKFLFKNVKNINAQDKEGRSALTHAINRNNVEVAKFLIEKGADLSVKDKGGNNLAYYLLNTYRTKKPESFNEKLSLLTISGIDMSAIQAKCNTLYHLAVEKNNLDLLKRLKEFKIDVNTKNKDGLTPLHLAAMKAKDADILKYLVSIGADITAKTDFEESVYDLAIENELLQKNNININFLK